MDRKLIESIPCERLKYGTHIDVEVYYTKGRTPRGYYISVKPVKHEGNMVSNMAFSGTTKLLLTTNRYSAKQFEKAVEMGRSEAPALVEFVKEQEKAA